MHTHARVVQMPAPTLAPEEEPRRILGDQTGYRQSVGQWKDGEEFDSNPIGAVYVPDDC